MFGIVYLIIFDLIIKNIMYVFKILEKFYNKISYDLYFVWLLVLNNLFEWIKFEILEVFMVNKMDICFIISELLGVVLIIGVWNYLV